MRMTVGMAVACLIAGTGMAEEASAAIRKFTNIPAQNLGTALQTLARERDIQVVYFSESIDALGTRGASGELTRDEALTQVLSGTGLTYRYVDAQTVTILPASTGKDGSAAPNNKVDSAAEPAAGTSRIDRGTGSAGGFWKRFRLAQLDTSTSQTSSAQTSGAPAEAARMPLEEVIVSAQKRDERLQNVPIAISVLGGKDLDRAPDSALREALNLVPGVIAAANNQNRGSAISIRGIVPQVGASSVAYYMDSVPFGFVRKDSLPDANVYDLERVEVLRGPQGTLYGASAQNGVVRVLTHDADLDLTEFKGRVSGSGTEGGGSNYRADMALNVPLVEDKLGVRAVVGYEDLGGWVDRPNRSEQDTNGGTVSNARLKLNARPTEALTVGLSAWRSASDYDGATASDENYERNVDVRAHEPIDVDFETYGMKLGYDFQGFSLTSNTSYIDYQNEGLLRSQLSGTMFYTRNDAQVAAQEIYLSSTTQSPFHWTAGAFYREADERQRQAASAPPADPLVPFVPPPNANSPIILDWADQSESIAVFGEVGYRFASDLDLTVGARYFRDKVGHDDNITVTPAYHPRDTFTKTTPRVALSWYVSEDLTTYASYSQGFRSGLMQSLAGRQFPAVKPDLLSNYELGGKGRLLDGRIAFDAALYYVEYDDVQMSIGVPFLGSFTAALINAESASGPGVDVAVMFELIDGLKVGLNGSWNDITVDAPLSSNGILLFNEGDRLGGSSEHTLGTSLDWLFGIGLSGVSGRLSAAANYQSSRMNRSLLGSNVLLTEGEPLVYSNASFSLSADSGRWGVTLFANNLTNEDRVVIPGVANALPDQATRMQPRTIGLQVDWRY